MPKDLTKIPLYFEAPFLSHLDKEDLSENAIR